MNIYNNLSLIKKLDNLLKPNNKKINHNIWIFLNKFIKLLIIYVFKISFFSTIQNSFNYVNK